MRRLLISLLLLACCAAGALAQAGNAVVYVVVKFDEFEALTAAEFKIANLPDDVCGVQATWYADETEGDIATGVYLSFDEPQAGPTVCLGYISLGCAEYVGDDYPIWVQGTDFGQFHVDDQDFAQHEALGGLHTFNCQEVCTCEMSPTRTIAFIGLYADQGVWEVCDQLLDESTPAAPGAWSTLKTLY